MRVVVRMSRRRLDRSMRWRSRATLPVSTPCSTVYYAQTPRSETISVRADGVTRLDILEHHKRVL